MYINPAENIDGVRRLRLRVGRGGRNAATISNADYRTGC